MSKRRVTIKDIAKDLGLSYATVSRALSTDPQVSEQVLEKTRKSILKKADELDYSPNLLAHGFVTGKTSTLGLLTHQSSPETFGSQTNHIMKMAKQHDYEIIVGMPGGEFPTTDENQVKDIRKLVNRGIDGLFVTMRGAEGESETVLKTLGELLPVVTLHYAIPNVCAVVRDDVENFCQATEHLIRLGHERIGFLGSKWDANHWGSDKAKGYLQAMEKYGLSPQRIAGKTAFIELAYQVGRSLGKKFTALVCRDDYAAMGVTRGLWDSGLRVPDDIAVVGNGDISVSAYVNPSLTTLATPHKEMAEAAMELMLEQIEGRHEIRQVKLKTPLIVRESCGANTPKKQHERKS